MRVVASGVFNRDGERRTCGIEAKERLLGVAAESPDVPAVDLSSHVTRSWRALA